MFIFVSKLPFLDITCVRGHYGRRWFDGAKCWFVDLLSVGKLSVKVKGGVSEIKIPFQKQQFIDEQVV
jgi:hypothetical protein